MQLAPVSASDRLRAIHEAYDKKDFASCEAELAGLRAAEPDQPEIDRWLARLAYREADWDKVHAHALAYLRHHPDDRDMAQLSARASTNLKLWNEAERAWEHVTALRPDWPEGWYQLGRAQAENDHLKAVALSAHKLRKMRGTGGQAELFAARLFVEADLLAEAKQAYAVVGLEDPRALDAEIAEYLRRENLRALAAAMSASDSLQEVQPPAETRKDLAERLIRRAIASERSGRLTEAYLDYTAANLLDADDALPARGQSRVLQKLQALAKAKAVEGRHEEAVSSYDELLRLSPSNDEAALQRAKLLTQLARWKEAAEAWSHFCELAPEDLPARVHRARAIERAGLVEGAEEAWRRVQELDPSNSEAERSLARLPGRMLKAARLAVAEQRLLDAFEILSKIPAEASERQKADTRLASLARYLRKEMRAAYKARNYLRMTEMSAAARHLLPQDPALWKLAAKAAMRVSNYHVAFGAWRRFLDLEPSPDVTHHLEFAKSCLHVREFDECRGALAAVLARDPTNESAIEIQLELREQCLASPQTLETGRTEPGSAIHDESAMR